MDTFPLIVIGVSVGVIAMIPDSQISASVVGGVIGLIGSIGAGAVFLKAVTGLNGTEDLKLWRVAVLAAAVAITMVVIEGFDFWNI